MTPLLFLDIDGVLNSERFFLRAHGRLDGRILPVSSHQQIDPDAVALLNTLTGVDIVISSSWRYSGLDSVRAELRSAGVAAPIIDATPEFGHVRHAEIAAWLDAHPERSVFAIVDDDETAGTPWPERFVYTSFKDGLTAADVTRLRGILFGEGGAS